MAQCAGLSKCVQWPTLRARRVRGSHPGYSADTTNHREPLLVTPRAIGAGGPISHPLDGRPDQYLFLFLKFISSVIPTMEYDYTI